MEKAERNFVDFCMAAQKNQELWKKLSQITDVDVLKNFFKENGFTIENEHIEKILETKKDIEKNMSVESDRDYY